MKLPLCGGLKQRVGSGYFHRLDPDITQQMGIQVAQIRWPCLAEPATQQRGDGSGQNLASAMGCQNGINRRGRDVPGVDVIQCHCMFGTCLHAPPFRVEGCRAA